MMGNSGEWAEMESLIISLRISRNEQSTYVEKSLLQESAEESHYILKSRKYTNFLLKYKQKLGKPLEA